MRALGNLLIAVSLIGLAGLGAVVMLPEGAGTSAGSPGPLVHVPWFGSAAQSEPPARGATNWNGGAAEDPLGGVGARTAGRGRDADSSLESTGGEFGAGDRAITHIEIPSIDLSADVVEASLVDVSGGATWQVPAFKVGHAEGTANAGEVGNAVLLGHVTSLRSGNVFQDLDKVRVGDVVDVFTDGDHFEYQVVSTSAVPRTDTTVLQPTDTPTLSMITCTGIWLPTIWDYTERLVVRAELSR